MPLRPLLTAFTRLALVLGCASLLATPGTAYAAGIVVDTLDDVVAADGDCSLREAIDNANDNAATHADCVAGSGADTITFSVTGTIQLDQALGGASSTSFPQITDPTRLTIDGGAQAITLLAGDFYRFFWVEANATLELRHLTLTDGFVDVAGGAIAVLGTLETFDVTFHSNGVGGSSEGGAIHNEGTAIIDASTFTGNDGDLAGGAIVNIPGAVLTVTNSTFSGNVARSGGAIVNRGSMTVTNSTFHDNFGIIGGGAITAAGADSDTTLRNVTINSNRIFNPNVGQGAGLRVANGTTTLINTIIANSVTDLGAAGDDCVVSGGTLTDGGGNLIEDGTCVGVDANEVDALTGDPGLAPLADNGGLTLTHALVPDSPAINAGDDAAVAGLDFDQRGAGFPRSVGGAVDIGAVEFSGFTVNNITDAVDTNIGDGICATAGDVCTLRAAIQEANFWGSSLTITLPAGLYTISLPGFDETAAGGDLDIAVGNNLTIQGAGAGATIIQGCTVAPLFNTCVGMGGTGLENQDHLFNSWGSLTLADVTIRHTRANGGGPLRNENGGSLTLLRSVVTANQGSAGSALLNLNGTVNVIDSTITGNIAPTEGVIRNGFGGTITVTNSTISGNTGGDSSGILSNNNGTLLITGSTVAANTGVGVARIGGTVTLSHSIVARSSGADCSGAIGDGGHNLIEDAGACGAITNGDNGNVTGALPLIGLLQDNGGPTLTHALFGGSPAIDRGLANCGLSADQRGVARPQGGFCDIGAFEVAGVPTPVPSTLTVNDNADAVDANIGDALCATAGGVCTLRAAIQEANFWAGIVPVTVALPADTYTLTLGGLENAAASGDLDVIGEVTLQGAGAGSTFIQACTVPQLTNSCANLGGTGVTDRVFHIPGTGSLVLEDLTVRHGRAAGGGVDGDAGGLFLQGAGTLTLTRSAISLNYGITNGGGIRSDAGTLTIDASTINGNGTAGFGSGILVVNGSAAVTNSTISGNVDADANGVVVNFGTASFTLLNSTVFGNTGTGVRRNNGTLTVTNTISAGNTVADFAGTITAPVAGSNLAQDGSLAGARSGDPLLGALADNGGPTFTHALPLGSPAFNAGNNAAAAGLDFDQRGAAGFDRIVHGTVDIGAFEFDGTVPSAFVVDSTDDAVDASIGDGVCATAGDECTLRAAIAEANAVPGAQTITFSVDGEIELGAALPVIASAVTIDADGQAVTISGADTYRPFTVNGGALLELRHLTVADGSANVGGAVSVDSGGTLSAFAVMFRDNTANQGGAIHNLGGGVTVDASTFMGNAASFGGAITTTWNLTVTNSTFTGNTAGIDGGAIHWNSGAGTLAIANTTFSGNTSGGGGGALTAFGGVVNVTNTTLTANDSTSNAGDGIYVEEPATVTLINTIVAGNSGGNDCEVSGGTITGTNNLIGEASCGSITNGANGNITGVAANLGALADNGGPTQTHALLVSSPAISAGSNAAAAGLDFDQRGDGFARVVGGTVDIGAFEFDGVLPTAFVVNSLLDVADQTPGDGICATAGSVCTLRAAIAETNAVSGAQTITFSVTGTIQLDLALVSFPYITDPAGLTIDGDGQAITVRGNNAFTLFIVEAGGLLELRHLALTRGANGGAGGGAITVAGGGTLETFMVTFHENSATEPGGAISSAGTVTVDASVFIDNLSDRGGGAISNEEGGILTVTNSAFINNEAGVLRGGGAITSVSVMTVTNSTFSGNTAFGAPGGGTIRTAGAGGDATLRNVTITGGTHNLSNSGAGLRVHGGTATLINTIIANSTTGGDCFVSGGGTLTDGGGNLIEDGTCVGGGANQLAALTGDPLLVPLADNGGPTQTHALLAGSKAINAGSNAGASGLTTDQRGAGFARVVGGTVDIGAFEFDGTLPTAFVVDSLLDVVDASIGDGICATAGSVCTLRAAIAEANVVSGAQTITFSVTGTITLLSLLPDITTALTIDGAGAITVSGNDARQIFHVTAAGNLSVAGLALVDGRVVNADGAAIFNEGILTVSDSTFSNNLSWQSGGAIASSGVLTVTDSTFTGNSVNLLDFSGFYGGAIVNFSTGVLTITGSTFTGNEAAKRGGAIFNQGNLTVIDSIFNDNEVFVSEGGAIFNEGDLTVTGSTFSGNDAFLSGGAIFNEGPTLTVTNSTFSGNTTSEADGGGAIGTLGNNATLRNLTISGNSTAASAGAGLRVRDGTVTLTNTIIANSTTGGDCFVSDGGTLTDGGGNLIEDGTCVGGGANQLDALTGDPLLVALAENGGLTQTHALLAGSKAINAGNNAGVGGLTTDQRGAGFDRIAGGTVDIGAFEFNGALPTAFVVDSPLDVVDASIGDGICATAGNVCTLRAAIAEANAVFGAQTITFSVTGRIQHNIPLFSYPAITDPAGLTIDGDGRDITLAGILDRPYFVVAAGGSLELRHLTLTESNSGGTVEVAGGGTLEVFAVTFHDNSSAESGGAIYNAGTVTIDASVFSENFSDHGGGAIHNNDDVGAILTVTNSTFVDNATGLSPGGGAIRNGGTLTVTNSTFSGNQFFGSVGGGAIVTVNDATLRNVTITGSSTNAGAGGGLRVYNGTVTLINTIIANSIGGDCVVSGGTLVDGGGNLIQDGTCVGGGVNEIAALTGDPLLGPLANNGGLTPTHALFAGSKAINAGNNNGDGVDELDFDQRGTGFDRIVGGTVDIGAFEFSGTLPTAFEVDSTADAADASIGDGVCETAGGDCTLRAAIAEANAIPGAQTITFDATLNGQTLTLTAGQLVVSTAITIDGANAVTISGNNASRIFNLNGAGDLNLIGLTLADGKAGFDNFGGAVQVSGTAFLSATAVTFRDNTTGCEHSGGAIMNLTGTVTITASTFTGNTAECESGGAISNNSVLTVTNSTFSGNTAGWGGAIYSEGTANLTNVTISDNIAIAGDSGGGIFAGPGSTTTLTNTIIAGSTNRDCLVSGGTLTDGGGNLIEDGTCVGMNANEVDALTGDPGLAALANYGGLTPTYALLPSSQAIDAGDDGACADEDQRGIARPQGLACDIGAVEFFAATDLPPTAFTVNSLDDAADANIGDRICETAGGACTLRAAIAEADATPGPQTVGFAVSGTIALAAALPDITSGDGLTLNGAGQRVTLSGGGSVQHFAVAATGVLELRNLTVANGLGTAGGAVNNAGTLVVVTTTFLDNRVETNNVPAEGGAIRNTGEVTITNSTFSGNTATASSNNNLARGGALWNDTNGATSTITNSTFVANTAGRGGGIFNTLPGTGVVTMTNTILAGNIAFQGRECDGVVVSGGHNLFGWEEDCTLLNLSNEQFGFLPVSTPGISPLQDNGGPTPTHALLSVSSAVDAGDPATCALFGNVDQRGVTRDAACDIGAFEFDHEAVAPTAFAVDTVDDAVDTIVGDGVCEDALGRCTLRAAVQEANGWSGPITVTLPAGVYTLRIPSPAFDEESAAHGDLDVFHKLTIAGAGAAGTIVQACTVDQRFSACPDGEGLQDRVFDVVAGQLTLRDLTVRHGGAGDNGGGIRSRGIGLGSEALTLLRTVVTTNRTSAWAGGIYVSGSGPFSMTDSTVSFNWSVGNSGGIYVVGGAPTIVGSTINGNIVNASNAGGTGITISANSSLVVNTTISGNQNGAGAVNFVVGTHTFVNVTITDNVSTAVAGSGGFGGGLRVPSGTAVTLINSLVARNTALVGGDCSGPGTVTGHHNLIGDASCGSLTDGVDGNIVGVTAGLELGSLFDYGGFTQTVSLLRATSPAVGAGDPVTCADPATVNGVDQRGVARDGACDIGAFEYEADATVPFAFTVSSAADAVDAVIGDGICAASGGACTLRAAIQEASVWGGEPITIDLPAGTYTLGVSGAGEDAAATGDLDVRGPSHLTLRGAGAGSTVIQACTVPQLTDSCANLGGTGVMDRVFHVINGGHLALEDLAVRHGRAGGTGVDGDAGGIFNDGVTGALTLTRVAVTANYGATHGGGVRSNNGALTIASSTIDGNATVGFGAGVLVVDGTVAVSNSTISGNVNGTAGGVVENFAGATVGIVNSTIAGNTGTGLRRNGAGTVTLANTIVAGSSVADCTGSVADGGNNLIEGASCGSITNGANGNVTGVAPQLGLLADNGGPTLTHALLPNSPAIDAGDNGECTAEDQRGIARPQDAACDIGAVEFFAATDLPAAFTMDSSADAADANPGDGVCATDPADTGGVSVCTLRAAIEEANALDGAQTLTLAAGTTTALTNLPPITEDLVIEGQGPDLTTIDLGTGAGAVRGFVINNGVTATIRDLTTMGGTAPNVVDAGIVATVSANAELTIENVAIEDVEFTSDQTSAVSVITNGTLFMNDSTLSGSTVLAGVGSTAVAVRGAAEIRRSVFRDNTSARTIHNQGTTVLIEDTLIAGNTVVVAPIQHNSGTTTVQRSVIRDNTGEDADVAFNNGGTGLTLTHSVLLANPAGANRELGQDFSGATTATNNWWGSAAGPVNAGGATVATFLAALPVVAVDDTLTTGTAASLTATLENSAGSPVAGSGLGVLFTRSGANAGTADTFTQPWQHGYTGSNAGVDTVTAALLFGPFGLTASPVFEAATLTGEATITYSAPAAPPAPPGPPPPGEPGEPGEPQVPGPTFVGGELTGVDLTGPLEIQPGGVIDGGRLRGRITNRGRITGTITLGPDTVIEGGIVSGNITGAPDSPALILDADIPAGTRLENVVIGEGTVLDPEVILGPNVTFETNELIPPGIDLTHALPVLQGEFHTAPDLRTDVVDGAPGDEAPNILEQLGLLEDLAGFAISQLDSGELVIAGENSRSVLLPRHVSQAGPGTAPGIYADADGNLVFVTAGGRQVTAAPVLTDLPFFLGLLELRGLSLVFDADNPTLFRVFPVQGGFYYVGRAGAAAVPAFRSQQPGLHAYTLEEPANVTGFSVIFVAGNGVLMEQDLVPMPTDWDALRERLAAAPALSDIRLDENGVISVLLNGARIEGRAGYVVTLGAPSGSNIVILQPAGDINGDGTGDYYLRYPNGETQALYVYP